MEKKYTVFVSSTYEDLQELRELASKAIFQMGHIPLGMEMLRASDARSWQLITKNIDQSDYYVVIIARRYGSIVEGISITEREYDYAVKAGVPTLAFVLNSKASWPLDRIEDTHQAKAGLKRFTEKVCSKQVDFWKDESELQTKIAIALMNEIAANPRPGWVRASELAGPQVAEEISRLSRENAILREHSEALEAEVSRLKEASTPVLRDLTALEQAAQVEQAFKDKMAIQSLSRSSKGAALVSAAYKALCDTLGTKLAAISDASETLKSTAKQAPQGGWVATFDRRVSLLLRLGKVYNNTAEEAFLEASIYLRRDQYQDSGSTDLEDRSYSVTFTPSGQVQWASKTRPTAMNTEELAEELAQAVVNNVKKQLELS